MRTFLAAGLETGVPFHEFHGAMASAGRSLPR
jgi:hypothetical protein